MARTFLRQLKQTGGLEIRRSVKKCPNPPFARTFPSRCGPPFVGLQQVNNPSWYFTGLTDLELDILRRTAEIETISHDITPLWESKEDDGIEVAAIDIDSEKLIATRQLRLFLQASDYRYIH